MTERAILKRHAALVDRMATTLGVDLQETAIGGAIDMDELAEAVVRCTGCESPGACEKWLETHPDADAPPGYCRNGDLMTRLRPR